MAWRMTTLSLIAVLAVAPAAAQKSDALTAARFSLTVDGHEIASFLALGALDMRSMPATLVLERGRSAAADMWAWHEAARQGGGRTGRKNAVLVAYDRAGKPVARFHLTNAWPSKIYVGGRGGSDRRAETVTMVCEHIQRVAP